MNDSLSPKSLNDLGDAYYYGIDRPANLELAYTFYKQAADLDNPVGLFNVGFYFFRKKEFAKAIEYLEKSRACGHSPAALLLGELHRAGNGFSKNKKKAFKLYLEAAKLADIDAYNAVGECYKTGYGCGKNPEKSLEYYQKSADQQNVTGELNVGLYHLESAEYKKSPEQAILWLDKAAANGSAVAMRHLLKIYTDHTHPYFKKKSLGSLKEMAFYYQEALAKAGDSTALKLIADSYYNGTEPAKKNHEKSALYYKALADIGNDDGKYGYAVSLLYGQGVPKNIVEAKHLLEECAKNSHPSALTRLGDIFRLGLNVPIDFEEAKKWYTEGAKQNDPEALMNLGLLHYKGQIANQSVDLAFNFMDSAAKKGYFQALYWLGIFHDKGIGCPVSFSEAEKSFQKAIQKGSLGAKYKYASMILDEVVLDLKSPKKTAHLYQTAKDLFIEYVIDPLHNVANLAYAMDYLGRIYKEGLGVSLDVRISRYWYESAAMANLPKAMVEMYKILLPTDFERSLDWLKKATQDSNNAEAFYELGLLYQNGVPNKQKIDMKLAKINFEIAAKLNHKGALEKIMMM
jgi:TPR repeat protein